MIHDLTFVAPERRAEVKRRIKVIERFIAQPGRKAAEEAADQLGIRAAQFYNLVRAWRVSRRPEEITSGGGPRNRRPDMSAAQLAAVSNAIIANTRAKATKIVDEALARATAAGIEMPPRDTVSRYVRRSRPAMLAEDAEGADLIVDHTVLDLPVAFSSGAKRPLMTIVIDVPNNAIIGLALGNGSPTTETTAAALLDAISQSLQQPRSGVKPSLRVRLVAKSSGEADEIASLLADNGLEVQVENVGAHSGGQYAEALIGSRKAGIRLLPRLVWHDGSRRLAKVTSEKTALTPKEAFDLCRGRLAPPPANSVLNGVAEGQQVRLVAGLAQIVRDVHASG